MVSTPHDTHSQLIDTHAHLSFSDFDADRDEVLARAWDAPIEYIVTIGSGQGVEGNHTAVALAHTDPRIFAAVGIHPHDAEKEGAAGIEALTAFIGQERVVALGEMGLDYHYHHSSREAQEACFRAQLKLAHRHSLPVIIHDREAHAGVWRIIEDEGVPPAGGVFHCFSGDVAFAEKVVAAGFFISIPGIVTFDRAHDMQGVAAMIPLERLLLETDSPYLAPIPHRGRRNEPAYLIHTARKIAAIKGVALSDVARVTTLNAKRLFNLPGADIEPRIAYRIRNALYLNITNRCNCACTFCPKATDDYEVKGHCLKLAREPDVEQIFQAMGHPEQYEEVVFCGFGEPTKRLELLKEVARRMRASGVKRIRLNTDGLANLLYGRNVLPELKGLIDAVSVSLNAPDAATYARICPSAFKERAFAAVKQFIKDAKDYIPDVTASVVGLPDLDIEACRRVAEQELGVTFRLREYMQVG